MLDKRHRWCYFFPTREEKCLSDVGNISNVAKLDDTFSPAPVVQFRRGSYRRAGLSHTDHEREKDHGPWITDIPNHKNKQVIYPF